MVDTYVSGAYGEIRVGSSPIQDIIYLSEKSDKSDKKYTVYGISQKLARNSMRYDELKFFGRSFRLQYKVWKTNKWIIKNAPSF